MMAAKLQQTQNVLNAVRLATLHIDTTIRGIELLEAEAIPQSEVGVGSNAQDGDIVPPKEVLEMLADEVVSKCRLTSDSLVEARIQLANAMEQLEAMLLSGGPS